MEEEELPANHAKHPPSPGGFGEARTKTERKKGHKKAQNAQEVLQENKKMVDSGTE